MLKKLLTKKLILACTASVFFCSAYAQTDKQLAESEIYKNHNKYNLSLDKRFVTTLFAAPPYVEYVTALSPDIDGTVYISIDPNGSLGKTEGVGKIVTAKDTDGDGKADVYKNFIPVVNSARGGHIVAGTFYLLHPPYLTAYTDTDGDGVADKKKLLANGFGGGIEHPRGGDHTTNGARMGIDGWLYISVGDFGMMNSKGADGAVVQQHGGGVARIRPDGSELEVYIYNTRNQFDVAISPTLEIFTRDNTNDGKGWNLRIHHQVAESDFGYPRLYQNFPDEHIQSLADYGGGSGMGCLFLDEPGFPEDLNNRLYTCDWTSGKIFKFDMKPNDATYTVMQSDFTDLIRAADIDVDGQSNLYLADWQGGKFRYEGKGVPVSRIHMTRLKDYKAPAVPNLKTADEASLLKHLTGTSSSIRLQAQQYLLKKNVSAGTLSSLAAIVKDKSQHINVRVAALFTLKQAQGEKSHTLCQEILNDASMRVYALKALTDRKTQMSNVDPDLFIPYLSDADPKVRLQAAVSLRRLNKYSAKSVDALIKMAAASWQENSVGSLGTMPLPHLASRALAGLGQKHAAAWKQYVEVFKKSDLKTKKALTYALKTIHNTDLVKTLIKDLTARDIKDETRLMILDILARLSHKEEEWDVKAWWGTRPKDSGPYFKGIEWEMTKAVVKAIEESFPLFAKDSQLKVIDLISKNLIEPSSIKLVGVDTLISALEAKAPNKQYIDILKNAALDLKRPWSTRSKAAKKLAGFQSWLPKNNRGKIINSQKAAAATQRAEAVKAFLQVLAAWQKELPKIKDKAGIDFIEALIHDYWSAEVAIKTDLPALAEIANQLSDEAATLAWKKILFANFRTIGPRSKEAEPVVNGNSGLHNAGYYQAAVELYILDTLFVSRAKQNLNWDHEGVRKAAAAVLYMHKKKQSYASSPAMVTAGIAGAKEYALKNKGDAALGKILFNKQGCIACHAVNNAAVQKGPFLGAAGSQFTREFLIDSILNPLDAIAQGFPTYKFSAKENKGGEIVFGFLVDEDKVNYTVMDSTGYQKTILKANQALKEIVPGSLMPPGLVFNLNLHEFTSLVEYLNSMK